jgi:hypothetical protein
MTNLPVSRPVVASEAHMEEVTHSATPDKIVVLDVTLSKYLRDRHEEITKQLQFQEDV